MIVYKAEDGKGNIAECKFSVIVSGTNITESKNTIRRDQSEMEDFGDKNFVWGDNRDLTANQLNYLQRRGGDGRV